MTCVFTDNEAPVFTSCVDHTFPTSLGLPTAYVIFERPDATDNAGGLVTVNCVDLDVNGVTLQLGIHSFVCIAIAQDSPTKQFTACDFNITIEGKCTSLVL